MTEADTQPPVQVICYGDHESITDPITVESDGGWRNRSWTDPRECIRFPTVVLTAPTRHIHSHIGLLSQNNTENTIRLLVELLNKLDWNTANSYTEI